jgi:hypothetical protein
MKIQFMKAFTTKNHVKSNLKCFFSIACSYTKWRKRHHFRNRTCKPFNSHEVAHCYYIFDSFRLHHSEMAFGNLLICIQIVTMGPGKIYIFTVTVEILSKVILNSPLFAEYNFYPRFKSRGPPNHAHFGGIEISGFGDVTTNCAGYMVGGWNLLIINHRI